MMRNSAKSIWTYEELGWEFLPPGNIMEWDGLKNLFIEYFEREMKNATKNDKLLHWYKLAKID
jgi:hypothetical protein